MREAIPVAWRLAASRVVSNQAQASQEAGPDAAMHALVPALGWQVSDSASFLALSSRQFSVRAVTSLLCRDLRAARDRAHIRYVKLAASPDDAAPDWGAVPDLGGLAVDAALPEFRRQLSLAWAGRWGNDQKEVLWRLAVGGVRAAGGHGLVPAVPCTCGWTPDRVLTPDLCAATLQKHAFWSCPVAQAVVEQLKAALPPPTAAALRCRHVWLMSAPDAVPADLWRGVAMAAVSAMYHGRRQAWRLHCERQQNPAAGFQQLTLEQAWRAGASPQQQQPAQQQPAAGDASTDEDELPLAQLVARRAARAAVAAAQAAAAQAAAAPAVAAQAAAAAAGAGPSGAGAAGGGAAGAGAAGAEAGGEGVGAGERVGREGVRRRHPLARGSVVERAAASAATNFWIRLQDFASAQASSEQALPPGTAFFESVPDGNSFRLHIRRPELPQQG
jgi:hypothetical protein